MKSAYELKHCSGVTAVALTFNGEFAGKIAANWGDSRYGATCTVTLSVTRGPLVTEKGPNTATDRAGGSGYDKFSSALVGALMSLGKTYDELKDVDAGNPRKAFEDWGYKYLEVI